MTPKPYKRALLDQLMIIVCLVTLMFTAVWMDSAILAALTALGALIWPFRAIMKYITDKDT